jgi:hypothetical protein
MVILETGLPTPKWPAIPEIVRSRHHKICNLKSAYVLPQLEMEKAFILA